MTACVIDESVVLTLGKLNIVNRQFASTGPIP